MSSAKGWGASDFSSISPSNEKAGISAFISQEHAHVFRRAVSAVHPANSPMADNCGTAEKDYTENAIVCPIGITP
jgi:hypothetical protein